MLVSSTARPRSLSARREENSPRCRLALRNRLSKHELLERHSKILVQLLDRGLGVLRSTRVHHDRLAVLVLPLLVVVLEVVKVDAVTRLLVEASVGAVVVLLLGEPGRDRGVRDEVVRQLLPKSFLERWTELASTAAELTGEPRDCLASVHCVKVLVVGIDTVKPILSCEVCNLVGELGRVALSAARRCVRGAEQGEHDRDAALVVRI